MEEFRKVYRHTEVAAVDSVSFSINNGEIVGLVGLNGAGKTTILNGICGITVPTSGSVFIDGFDLLKEKERASIGIGWVAEFPSFEQDIKPASLLRYFAGFYGRNSKAIEEKINEIINTVGLAKAANRKIKTYSQGMKKRFALAAAMLSSPRNYVLDEILNGLDPDGVNTVRKILLEAKSRDKAILLSTHILPVLEDLADRVLILHNGQIIENIPMEKLRSVRNAVVEIEVDRTDDKILKLLSSFGTPSIKKNLVLLQTKEIDKGTREEIADLLFRSGYRVSKIEIRHEALQDFFLDLIGEKDEANII